MTKSNLEQIYYLSRELKLWETELERIKCRSLVQPPLPGAVHGSGISDKVADRGDRTVVLEADIAQRKILIKEVYDFIKKIPDAKLRTIVTSHCRNADSWEKTVELVGGKVTLEGIQKQYYRFIKKTFG